MRAAALDDLLDLTAPLDLGDLDRAWEAAQWGRPRYFQAPSVLASGGYLQLHLNDTYTVLKWRRFYAQVQAYAILPPVSLRGDVGDERRTADVLRALGFGLRCSPGDLDRLGLAPIGWQPVGGEYLYRLGDLASLHGQRRKHLRNARNRAAGDPDLLATTTRGPVPRDVVAMAVRWSQQRGKGARIAQHLAHVGAWHSSWTTALRYRGQVVAYSVSERVPQGIVGAWGARDFRSTAVHDPAALVWHLDAVALLAHSVGSRASLVNVGIARDAGQARFKERMQPCDILPLVHVPARVQLVGSDYRPAGNPAQLGLAL